MINLVWTKLLRTALSISGMLSGNCFSFLSALNYHISLELSEGKKHIAKQSADTVITEGSEIKNVDCDALVDKISNQV